MRKIFLVILVGVLTAAGGSRAWAQNDTGNVAGGADNFSQVKAEMLQLLEDNRKLQAQYDQLMLQKETLEQNLEAVRKGVSGVSDTNIGAESEGRSKSQKIIGLQEEMKKIHAVALAKHDQVVALRAKLQDFDAKQDLLELKLRDLEYQQKDEEKNVSEIRSALASQMAAHKGEIEKLQEQLRQIEEQRQKVVKEQRDMEAVTGNLSERIPVLQSEVSALSAEADNFTAQKALRIKENTLLKDKKLLAEKTYEVSAVPLEGRAAALKEEVARLEAEYQMVLQQIEGPRGRQKQRRELVDEVIRLEKENQALLKKIESIKKKDL